MTSDIRVGRGGSKIAPKMGCYKGQGKGQLIQKADWRAIDSPKKRTDEFDLFAKQTNCQANKTNSSICFMGEVSRP